MRGASVYIVAVAVAAAWATPATSSTQEDSEAAEPGEPEARVVAGPDGDVSYPHVRFEFTHWRFADAEPRAVCSIDQGSPTFGQCTRETSHAAGPLDDGDYTFRVRVSDSAGNVDEDARDFVVDTVPPGVTIHSAPTGTTADATPSFHFHSADPGATFFCGLAPYRRGATPELGECSGTGEHAAAGPLDAGMWAFRVVAADEAGNRSAMGRQFIVGSSAVTPTLLRVPRDRTRDRTPTYRFGSGERGVSFHCRIDTRELAPCASPQSYRVRPGRHVFKVVAIDSDGRVGPPARDFVRVLRRGSAARQSARVPHFGFNEDWLIEDAFIEQAARTGSDTARFNVSWSEVEPRPGHYRWELYDSLYTRMLAMGMRPVLVLLDAPCWTYSEHPRTCAATARPAVPPQPYAVEAFSRFAGMVAQRYPRARGIEVWNEPNFNDYWRTGIGGDPGTPQPTRYAELLAAAYEGIKAANPRMPVVFAGLLAGGLKPADGMSYARFARQALAAGARGHFDAIAIHPYPFFAPRPARKVRDTLTIFRRVLESMGEPRVPLWVTEVGVSTSGPKPLTLPRQARSLAAIHNVLARTARVPVAIFHRMVDDPRTPASRESGWGVMSSTGAPKPAVCALARARWRELC